MRVLLLEDNPGDAALVRFALRQMDNAADLAWVARLQDAVARLDKESFDVIMTDLTLPDARGLDAVTALRQKAPTCALVVLTSKSDDGITMSALDQGVQDYLVKDQIDATSLQRSVRFALQRQAVVRENAMLLQQVEESKVALEERNARLRQLNETAYEFVDEVSHDFRSPLTVIKEYASLVGEGLVGSVSDEQRRMLGVIETRADDLNTMMDDMLDVSRFEAGLLSVWRRPCPVSDAVGRVMPTLERRALEKRVTLRTDVPECLPAVYCDLEKVGRVITNLAVNAIKFCGNSGLVRVWAQHHDATNEIMIGVTDNGPGIPQEQVDRIFERFAQLDHGVRCGTKGFGLGLSIAKQLVRANFGRMGVESQVGEGSTFWFTVPLALPHEVVSRCLANHEDAASLPLSLLRMRAPEIGDERCGQALDEFVQDLVKCDELVYRINDLEWLIILARQKLNVTDFIRDASQQLSDLNRNRPLGPLPEVAFECLGTWPAGAARRELLLQIDLACHVLEPALG